MIYLPMKVLVYTLKHPKQNVSLVQCKGMKPVDQSTSTGSGAQNTYTQLQLHLQIT